MGSSPPYVGRFAPTPNGPMHPGTAAAALLAESHARAHAGRFLLRWDDLDRLRCPEEKIVALRADLIWLGVTWEQEFRQSQRTAIYERHLSALVARGGVYACRCTRSEIKRRTGSTAYDGHCRPNRLSADALARHLDACRALRPGGTLPALRLAAAGDPVVWSAEGYASYTFSCAVDEAEMGITHVVRGADLLIETDSQLAVLAALGLPAPAYVHFPLMLDAEGRKLSKSARAPALRDTISAADFRDWVGREYFDPPVAGGNLAEGWRGRVRAPGPQTQGAETVSRPGPPTPDP